MGDLVKTTKKIGVDEVKIAIYGSAGVGKTLLASTLEDVIILSSENGLLSLSEFNIPFINITSLSECNKAYNYLKKDKEAQKYKNVFIDTVSEVAEVLLAELKPNEKDARQAYMKMGESTIAMIKKFRDLEGFNVIFICKELPRYDEDGNVISYEPGMPGRLLGYNLPYLVDELFCMRLKKDGTRYLQTSATRRRPAKDRSGKLNPEEKPDLSLILNKIKGE